MRKIKLLAVLVALAVIACHNKPVADPILQKINTLRDGYNVAYRTAEALKGTVIDAHTWNTIVVPAGTLAHDAIDEAYLAYETYVTSKQQSDFDRFLTLLNYAQHLLDLFNSGKYQEVLNEASDRIVSNGIIWEPVDEGPNCIELSPDHTHWIPCKGEPL